MTTPALGYNSFIGVGEETGTWGVEVAPSRWFEINSGCDGLEVKEDKVQTKSVYGIDEKENDTIQGPIDAAGDMQIDMRFEKCGIWFKHALGAEGTSAANGTAATLHQYTIANSLPLGLSVEVKRDVKSFVYTGCKVNTLKMDVPDGVGIVQMTPGLVGKDCSRVGTSSTPTLSTSDFINSGVGSVTYAGTAKEIFGCTLDFNNDLKTNRRPVGQRTIIEPVRGAKAKFGGSFTIEFSGDDEYQDFRNATSREFRLAFTGDTITGTTTDKLEIVFPAIKLLNAPIQISDEGPVNVKLDFKGYALGTTGTSRAVYVNLTNAIGNLG